MPNNLVSEEALLWLIYRRLNGELTNALVPSPSAEFTLRKIEEITDLNLLNGRVTREQHYKNLYNYVSDKTFAGARVPVDRGLILTEILNWVPPLSLLSGLLGYWIINGDASVASDPTGIGSMSEVGAVGSVAGPSGVLTSAANFIGGDNYYQLADSGLFVPPTSFTIAGWHYIGSKATNRAFMSQSSNATDVAFGLYYHVTLNKYVFNVSPDGTESGNASAQDSSIGSPSLNTWYFLLGRYSHLTGRSRLKVNMLAESIAAVPVSMFNSPASIRIGDYGGTGHVGRAAYIGMWNREISNLEANWLFADGNLAAVN